MSEETFKCPNCGNEINKNQKFCANCGAKLEEIKKNDETDKKQNTENAVKSKNCFLTNKVIICIVIILALVLCTFGVVQHKQYKDIEPLEIAYVNNDNGTISINFKYLPNKQIMRIETLYKDIQAEDWMQEYCNDIERNYPNKQEKLFFIVWKDELLTLLDAKYNSILSSDSKNLIVIYDAKNIKINDFARIKDEISSAYNTKRLNINSNTPSISNKNKIVRLQKQRTMKGNNYAQESKELNINFNIPNIFHKNKIVRLQYKNSWLKEKETVKKQEEWKRNVLSNCVYKTSDGVCFTTQVFNAPFIQEEGKAFNYWLGAKEACESKGYRLPNDSEVRSLYADILNIKITGGINVKTYIPQNTPVNYDVLKKIAPDNEYWWERLELWENEEFDNKKALYRDKSSSFVDSDYTAQSFRNKVDYVYNAQTASMCVYDPNGKPRKSLFEIQKELEKELQKQKVREQQEAENALF